MSLVKGSTCNGLDIMKPEKEGQDSFDSIIRQAIGKDPFLLSSRPGDNPLQWIQFLNAIDQPERDKLYYGGMTENSASRKGQSLLFCDGASNESMELKESSHGLKDKGTMAGGGRYTAEQMQTLKIPEAVAAFTQAAARVNGEPEKYLPGWPLLSPSRVQMQKCKKCSREFCSPINYRRHVRVHRRLLNRDKDFARNRELLGVFWDKLSFDEAKEIVSFASVSLEEVTGSSIIRALSSWIRKPGFSSLPHMYAKAGATLLDLIQANPSGLVLPISSQDLFSVLDDASERTFLCAGTAVSLQKFVSDGQVGKIALEMNNLVASLSFLLEQQLVKACLADKDAEALRCHKLLMEEEEAAQRRHSQLLEKKRLRKLRQKTQKEKDLIDAEDEASTLDIGEANPDPIATFDKRTPLPSDLLARENLVEQSELHSEPAMDVEMRLLSTTETADQSIDLRDMQTVNDSQQVPGSPLSNQENLFRNGFDLMQVSSVKSSFLNNPDIYKEEKGVTTAVGHKIWTKKRTENGEECLVDTVDKKKRNEFESIGSSKVLIGSISITIGCTGDCSSESASLRCNSHQEKLLKPDATISFSPGKQWVPAGCHKVGYSTVFDDKKEFMGEFSSESVSNVPSITSDKTLNNDSEFCTELDKRTTEDSEVRFLYSIRATEVFLAQRWNEAIAADHVKLLLPSENEKYDSRDIPKDFSTTAHVKYIYSGNDNETRERRVTEKNPVRLLSSAFRPKLRSTPEKLCKQKYIPKPLINVTDK